MKTENEKPPMDKGATVYSIVKRDKNSKFSSFICTDIMSTDLAFILRQIIHTNDNEEYAIEMNQKVYECTDFLVIDNGIVKLSEDCCADCEFRKTCFRDLYNGMEILTEEQILSKVKNIIRMAMVNYACASISSVDGKKFLDAASNSAYVKLRELLRF